MPVHTLCVNSYTNIPVHTSIYLYIPVYHRIWQYKRIWKICITIGIELTTSCIVSAWLYRFARSINASVCFLSFLWYILWLCSVPGTRRLAAGVGCLARVPRASDAASPACHDIAGQGLHLDLQNAHVRSTAGPNPLCQLCGQPAQDRVCAAWPRLLQHSCITMLSLKTCYMISTYQYIPVHTIFGLYIQACICTY